MWVEGILLLTQSAMQKVVEASVNIDSATTRDADILPSTA